MIAMYTGLPLEFAEQFAAPGKSLTPEDTKEIRKKLRDSGCTIMPVGVNLRQPVPEGYVTLATVLEAALKQAAFGKGKERHARGTEPFERQQLCELTRMVGPAGPAYQVMKKTREALRLPRDQAVAELLGAINYAAAAVIVLQEGED